MGSELLKGILKLTAGVVAAGTAVELGKRGVQNCKNASSKNNQQGKK